jgi:hypothetical protein
MCSNGGITYLSTFYAVGCLCRVLRTVYYVTCNEYVMGCRLLVLKHENEGKVDWNRYSSCIFLLCLNV